MIAILAAMLLPALSKARDAAKGASCQNNLKPLGAALMPYIGDSNDFLPLRLQRRGETDIRLLLVSLCRRRRLFAGGLPEQGSGQCFQTLPIVSFRPVPDARQRP